MSFVTIQNGDETEVFLTDSAAELAEAQAALRDAGLESAPVYVGDPDGDHHASGMRLFAAEPAVIADGFMPTHRLIFTPPKGAVEIYDVMLDEEAPGQGGPAYSSTEWDSAAIADWELVDGAWLFQGQPTPGGRNGEVEVVAL